MQELNDFHFLIIQPLFFDQRFSRIRTSAIEDLTKCLTLQLSPWNIRLLFYGWTFKLEMCPPTEHRAVQGLEEPSGRWPMKTR